MKKNLSPTFTTIGLLVLCTAGILSCSLLTSCTTPPAALFTPQTNVVSETIVPKTNSVTVTNIVTEIVTKTNMVTLADGSKAPSITIGPVEHAEVLTRLSVEFTTNQLLKVTYVPSDNARQLADAAGSITNIFAPGVGGVAGKTALGILAIIGALCGHKVMKNGDVLSAVKASAQTVLENTAGALTQGIENYREIVKTTPQGAAADAYLMKALQKDTRVAGVADIVAKVVDAKVDNQAARDLADEVQRELARLTAGTPPAAPKV